MDNSLNLRKKLAAIMCTDISGFTLIASKNETEALDLLELHKKKIYPIIKKFNGIINKELGDGLLITFDLTSQAVECAIQIQKELISIDDLNLRIGIHEGEIAIANNQDAFGSDVNLTFRIEPFSAIGGIALSNKVEQSISSNPQLKTKFIASPKLKGVTQKMDIYALISDNLPFPDISNINAKLESKNPNKILLVSTFCSLLLSIILIFFNFNSNDYKNNLSTQIINNVSLPDNYNIHLDQINNLLDKQSLDDNFRAYELTNDLILLNDNLPEYKALLAQVLFQRALLMDYNEGLFSKSQSIILEIVDLDFIDIERKSYSYFILSKIEFNKNNNDLAIQHIKKAFYVSKSNQDVKDFWKELNKKKLQQWEI